MFEQVVSYLLSNLDLEKWVMGETSLDLSMQSLRVAAADRALRNAQTAEESAEARAQLEEAMNPPMSMRLVFVVWLFFASFVAPFWLLGAILEGIGISPTTFLRITGTLFAVAITTGSVLIIVRQVRSAREQRVSWLQYRAMQDPPLFTPFASVVLVAFAIIVGFMSWGTLTREASALLILAGVFYGSLIVSVILAFLLWIVIAVVERVIFTRLRLSAVAAHTSESKASPVGTDRPPQKSAHGKKSVLSDERARSSDRGQGTRKKARD